MEILSTAEIKKITAQFLAKYSRALECKIYEFGEVVRREGERKEIIYIVKNGVFRIGRIDTPKADVTLGFCFKSTIMPSIASVAQNYPSLLQIKSISNNIANCNYMYEISIEQWNCFAEKDEILKEFHASVLYNNFANLISLHTINRQNRKAEKLFSDMYDAKDPILNSGIDEKYIASFLGVTIDSLRRMNNNKILNRK